MIPFDIILRAALGGIFIALLLWLGQSHRPFIAGMLLFFPVLSLPAFYFMSLQHDGMSKVREAILGGLAALPIWIGFALALYWASSRFRPPVALGLSLGVWFALAGCVVAVRLIWFKS